MTGLMILANGFEDTEALATRDVLMRAGINVITASLNNELSVVSSHNLIVMADSLLEEINNENNYDFIILPGGGKGTENLAKSPLIEQKLHIFAENNKLLAAICAAPSVLGKYGHLKGKKFTCFKGFEKGFAGIFTGKEVERDGNIITARSMYYSISFALEIINYLLGSSAQENVYKNLLGL